MFNQIMMQWLGRSLLRDSCCCLTGFKFPGNKDWYVVNSNQGNHLENLHVVLQCVFLTDYEQVGIQGLLT